MNAPLRVLDEIAPQHEWIHSRLELWGRSSRHHPKRLLCGSAEKLYYIRGIEHESRPKPVGLNAEEFRDLDRAVLHLPELHRRLIAEYYVHNCPIAIIRRRLRIHHSHFAKLIFDSRAGVLNQLRRAL